VVIRGSWKGKRFDSSRVILLPRDGYEDAAVAVGDYQSVWWKFWDIHPWPVEGEEETFFTQEWPKGESDENAWQTMVPPE